MNCVLFHVTVVVSSLFVKDQICNLPYCNFISSVSSNKMMRVLPHTTEAYAPGDSQHSVKISRLWLVVWCTMNKLFFVAFLQQFGAIFHVFYVLCQYCDDSRKTWKGEILK